MIPSLDNDARLGERLRADNPSLRPTLSRYCLCCLLKNSRTGTHGLLPHIISNTKILCFALRMYCNLTVFHSDYLNNFYTNRPVSLLSDYEGLNDLIFPMYAVVASAAA